MFKLLTRPLPPRTWFGSIIIILLVISVTYLLLHKYLEPGRSFTKLTLKDITVLSALIYDQETPSSTPPVTSTVVNKLATPNKAESKGKSPAPKENSTQPNDKTGTATASLPSSQHPLTAAQRQKVHRYIVNTYQMQRIDSDTLKIWIGLFEQPGSLISALKDHGFKIPSYFWLTDGGLYWEIIFWAWFGLIANLLYNVSEALRTGSNRLITGEVWTHIAKFFYAPLCSIAVFLGLSLAITDQTSLDQVNFSPNQVLVAFIMGFFSGRVVDLLQRIKNVIFPDGITVTPITGAIPDPTLPAPNALGLRSPGNMSTGSLALNDVQTIIRQHGAIWQRAYPNVTGLAAQIKTTAGQPTGQASILFEVVKKTPNLVTGLIPTAFNVTMPDGRHVILPTDVQEVGVTRFNYRAGDQIHSGLPTAVGSSVASLTGTGWGTMGLRVRDRDNEYVLTCCHVLCGHLINNDTWQYVPEAGKPVEVIVPAKDLPHNKIGEVVMATFNSSEDFALVRLTDPSQIKSQPVGQKVTFTSYQTQLGDAVMNRVVQMVGAFSNFQFAEVIATYQEGQYEDVPGLGRPARMQGLIKTELLSTGGDSGAAVYLRTPTETIVLGLLIASNDSASYVLPVRDYFIKHGLTLSTTPQL